MKLARIIDLEAQLARDLAAESDDRAWEQVLARDRDIAAQLAADGLGDDDPQALFEAWLRRVETASDPLPGSRVVSGLSAVRLVLVVAGLLAGAGLVFGLKQAVVPGPLPYINVPVFWIGLVGLQLALLVLLALSGLLNLSGLPGFARRLALMQAATTGACRWMLDRVLRSRFPEQAARLGEGLARVSGKRLYYGRIAQWLVMGISQRAAVAFNIAALGSLLLLGNVEQLSFGWSTTRSANTWFPDTVRVLSAPWRGFMPGAAPGPGAIAATRITPASVPAALQPAHMETWWRFMLMNLLVYGLLLRLLLWGFSAWQYRVALRRMPLDHEDFLRLRNRLTRTWFVDPAAAPRESPVVVWGALPADLRGPVDARISAVHGGAAPFSQAGHTADPEQDEQLCRTLGDRRPGRVVLMIPVWNEPIDELGVFLARLRNAVGPDAEILVDLVDVADGRLHAVDTRKKMVWESFLNRVRDPRLTAMASEASE